MTNHTRRQQQQSRITNQNNYRAQRTRHQQNYLEHHHLHQQLQQHRSQNIHHNLHTQNNSDCSVSICYSYLIAILSSFLVVLGIYLALTKFNARYLYISLFGFLIEALGACIYCVNNIHNSKIDRSKHTSTNGQNVPEINNSNNANQRRQMTRQPQATRATHILDNRTLNQTAISDATSQIQSTTDNQSRNIDESSNPEEQRITITSNDRLTENFAVVTQTEQLPQTTNSIPSSAPYTVQSNQARLVTGTALDKTSIEVDRNNSEQLPKNHSICQDFPDSASTSIVNSASLISSDNSAKIRAPIPDTLQSIVQNDNRTHKDVGLVKHSQQLAAVDSQANVVVTINSDDGRDLINLDQVHDNISHEHQLTTPQASGVQSESMPSGLQVANDEDIQVAKRVRPLTEQAPTQQQRQRVANVRRTLVMGLSGEEEVIEIDESDLDNMSILPPSYESIATSNNDNNNKNQ